MTARTLTLTIITRLVKDTRLPDDLQGRGNNFEIRGYHLRIQLNTS